MKFEHPVMPYSKYLCFARFVKLSEIFFCLSFCSHLLWHVRFFRYCPIYPWDYSFFSIFLLSVLQIKIIYVDLSSYILIVSAVISIVLMSLSRFRIFFNIFLTSEIFLRMSFHVSSPVSLPSEACYKSGFKFLIISTF